ncbi:hypothetical protein CRYUN_Cryun18bG0075100 [Craigia yunnanensis]
MNRMKFPEQYIIVILTFVSTCVCYIERVGFSIAYTIAADAAGINQSSKGTILSTFYYGYACSHVLGGWAAQKIGGKEDPNRVKILVVACLLVGVAQGFIFPSIHTVLAQWVPPHERSRSVSLTTSGMYLGAAMGMLALPSLVKFKGPNLKSEDKSGEWTKYCQNRQNPMEENFSLQASLGNRGLQLSLQEMSSSKMMPHFNMFIFSNIGGVLSDHLITKRIMYVTKTRKFLNTIGFIIASLALMALPILRTSSGAVFCSSDFCGSWFHGTWEGWVCGESFAPKYARIAMGVSNIAGTLSGC